MKPMPPLDAVREIERLRPTLGFPIDGAVLKVNSEMLRRQLGETSHSPRWAVAFKYAADTATTRLLDIELAIGRTGRLSLTAILEPVYVGGTTISRATLHHPQFVLDADLRIGDEVYVYRAGDVIPRVTTPVLSARPEGLPRWTPPETCPQCGEPLEKEGLIWRCLSPECSVAGRIRYFAGRDVMDIDGLDVVTAEALAESGMVNSIADLYNLTREQIANLPVGTTASGQPRLLGQKTTDRILSSLAEKTKTQPFARVITSLGIRNVGRSMGRRLAERFRNMNALRSATVEELASVEGIGPTKAERIKAGLTQMELVINRLIQAGVHTEIEEAAPVDSSLPLAGKKVCVTGAVPGMTRWEADHAIAQLGGTPTDSVTKTTNLLVIGDKPGSKVEKAEKYGVPTMTADEFLALLH
jgi:DNA ligase (NAD+)